MLGLATVTRQNYPQIMDWIRGHEGGFVNHPEDPGGKTNFGITQRTYDAFRKAKGFGTKNVRMIEENEVSEIYELQYWSRVQGDDLPSGVDYCVMDYAVNSGPARAIKVLQRAIGVDDDGVVGAITLAAARAQSPVRIVNDMCDERMRFLRRLKHWPTFKNGWTRRVAEVRLNSVALATNSPVEGRPDPASGKAPETLIALLWRILAFLGRIFGAKQ